MRSLIYVGYRWLCYFLDVVHLTKRPFPSLGTKVLKINDLVFALKKDYAISKLFHEAFQNYLKPQFLKKNQQLRSSLCLNRYFEEKLNTSHIYIPDVFKYLLWKCKKCLGTNNNKRNHGGAIWAVISRGRTESYYSFVYTYKCMTDDLKKW